jgi:hypothetical protein
MAGIFFLVLIVVVIGAWALIAYARAGAKAADTGIDRTNAASGPSLLEEDLSLAAETTPATRTAHPSRQTIEPKHVPDVSAAS